ncbi:MAG: patatin-like phospholipase family protein [Candidatus Bipolaricaulota bacterium]|nr:patatin-like phospholipase family protein [Candidatus Bipolaricaulota bacterium]
MKRVGLALSAGGARGIAHVGVLQALGEAGIPVAAVAGTSVGAYVGGLFAAGVPLDEITALWEEAGLWQTARFLLPTLPWRGWSTGEEFRRRLRGMLGDRRIEDLPIPFAAVVTDLRTGQAVALRTGDLVDAIRASISVPGLFVPAEVDGRTVIDGGVVHPLPVDVARALGAEVVVAVDVLLPPEEKRLGRVTVFAVLFQMATIFQKRIAELEVAVLRPEVVIRPSFGERAPTYTSAGAGREAGYRAAREALPQLQALLV